MILYMSPFAPWRLWPVERYSTQRITGDWWHDWNVYQWLFFTVEIRGRAVCKA